MDVPYLQARIEWETAVTELADEIRVEEFSNARPASGVGIVKVQAKGRKELREKIQSLMSRQRGENSLVRIRFKIPEEHQKWKSDQIREEIRGLPYVKSEINFRSIRTSEGWNFEGTYDILEQWIRDEEFEQEN